MERFAILVAEIIAFVVEHEIEHWSLGKSGRPPALFAVTQPEGPVAQSDPLPRHGFS
jgi:hypothetical protein